MPFRAVAFLLLAGCLLQGQTKTAGSTGPQPNPAAAAPTAPPLIACPAGAPLGPLDLQVKTGDQRLPFRTINHLGEGDSLLYSPILRGKEKRTGEVALVLVPEKRRPGDPDILVTDPKPADKPQEWKMTQTISLAALVYGPAGLNRKKVARFLSQDEVLVAQLADYADKTAQAEQLVATLSNAQSSAASVNAALNGFASEYGFAVQIDRNAPARTQASTLFAAMNPQLAAYNPLASSSAQTVGRSASLATMAGSLFFGSPVGLAAGGTAMLLDLRAIAFPDAQFRASFAQPLAGSASGVNLCGQQGPVPAHTRVAYIWASRVPNLPAPAIHVGDENFIPAGQKTALPVEVAAAEWKYLDRAREWALIVDGKKQPIPVVKLGNQQAIELDLTKAKVAAGDYKLAASWDWTPFQAVGVVHVVPLEDFRKARLDPASQDRVLAGSGKIPVTLRGGDFEFITKIELKKRNDEFATPSGVRFVLPKGFRKGPQDHMDLQLDTGDMEPGGYELLISQLDGKSHSVDFKVLPNPPKIDNLPIVVNQGVNTQHFVLKGERLGQLNRLEAPGAVFNLRPASADQTERSLTVELKSAPKPGATLPVTAYLEDRSEPMKLPGALEVTGPLPVIVSSKLSLPANMPIKVRGGEFPAGFTLNALLDVKNIERQSVLRLACADGVGESVALQIGQQTGTRNLQQLSQDQLFLAMRTDDLPAGCSLQAVIDSGQRGRSQPFTLAHIIRMPEVDSFALADTPASDGARQYQLTGQNLEMIGQVGWDKSTGVTISGLPTPLAGAGLRQSIAVSLPDPPAPASPIYIWLRGDNEGRESAITAPPLPVAKPEPTASTVTSSANPSFVGQPVTLVAKVDQRAAAGTISFVDGVRELGTATIRDGEASLKTGSLSPGAHGIAAVYDGDTKHAGSTSPELIQTVEKQQTNITLTSTPNPATRRVALEAVVAAAPFIGVTPTGIVTFYVDGNALGTSALDATGAATFSAPALPPGTHEIRAVYAGSSTFAESASAPITQVIAGR